MRRFALLAICFSSMSAIATPPSEAQVRAIEEEAIRARQNAIEACEDNSSGATCTKFRQEFARIKGTADAMREVAAGVLANPDSLEDQRRLVELHSAQAATNCKNAQFFKECQQHLDAVDSATAYIQTYGEYVPTESLGVEISDTRAVALNVIAPPVTGAAPQALCPASYGGLCKQAQAHVAETAETCDDSSAGAQCKSTRGDLVQISDELKVQAAAQPAAPVAQNP